MEILQKEWLISRLTISDKLLIHLVTLSSFVKWGKPYLLFMGYREQVSLVCKETLLSTARDTQQMSGSDRCSAHERTPSFQRPPLSLLSGHTGHLHLHW